MVLRELFRPPREPSALGIMVFSALVGIATAEQLNAIGTILAIFALLLHVFTFDAAFTAAQLRRKSRLALITILNAVPYIAATVAWHDYTLIVALLAYTPVLAAYLALGLRGMLRTPPGYVAGAALLSYAAILSAALAGNPTRSTLLAFVLMMLYTASTAAYVESRLPIRKTSPLLPLVLWLPAPVLAAVEEPVLLLTCIEPSAKLLANTARNTKIDMKMIKRLGWIEFARLTFFTALLVAVLVLLRA